MQMDPSVNVLGDPLQPCSRDPLTGFFRNGACDTCAEDRGSHTVCAVMTAEFLAFSKSAGNDLSTPRSIDEKIAYSSKQQSPILYLLVLGFQLQPRLLSQVLSIMPILGVRVCVAFAVFNQIAVKLGWVIW